VVSVQRRRATGETVRRRRAPARDADQLLRRATKRRRVAARAGVAHTPRRTRCAAADDFVDAALRAGPWSMHSMVRMEHGGTQAPHSTVRSPQCAERKSLSARRSPVAAAALYTSKSRVGAAGRPPGRRAVYPAPPPAPRRRAPSPLPGSAASERVSAVHVLLTMSAAVSLSLSRGGSRMRAGPAARRVAAPAPPAAARAPASARA